MTKYVLGFLAGFLLTSSGAWLLSGRFVHGAPQATGYTLRDIYDFIVSNGGTDPQQGNHSLLPQSGLGEGGMPTLTQIMEALRERFPCRSGGGGVLAATGQTRCYWDRYPYGQIDCSREDLPGQDGYYQAGCPMEGRFIDNGDGTVTDTCTGLMWQKASADTNEDGQFDAGEDRLGWKSALRFCQDLILCNDGTWTTDPEVAAQHAGIKYDDWRLPNINELESIVDYGRVAPSIDPVFEAESGRYWSSTAYAGLVNRAWAVWFEAGDMDLLQAPFMVRAVRTAR